MKPIGNEAVVTDDPGEALLECIDGKVHNPATLLTYQMVVIRTGAQVIDARTMAKVHMVQHPEALENLQGPIDGGHVDRPRATGPFCDVDRGKMLIGGCCQDLTDKSTLQRDPKARHPKRF